MQCLKYLNIDDKVNQFGTFRLNGVSVIVYIHVYVYIILTPGYPKSTLFQRQFHTKINSFADITALISELFSSSNA